MNQLRSRQLFLFIGVFILGILVGSSSMFLVTKKSEPQIIPLPSPTTFLDKSSSTDILLNVDKTSYRHDNKVAEPVRYTLMNNSSNTIYYLTGCAVTLPKIYQIKGSEKVEILQQQENVCEAIPQTQTLESKGTVDLYWNQRALDKFVPSGQYILAVPYYNHLNTNIHAKGEQYQALSQAFSIVATQLTLQQELQVCKMYSAGMKINSDGFYSEEYCLQDIQRLSNGTKSPVEAPNIAVSPGMARLPLLNTSCREDTDCSLINIDTGFDCSFAHACEHIDYSLDKWVAVNQQWWSSELNRQCPNRATQVGSGCGPRPINDNFTARCINFACKKVAK